MSESDDDWENQLDSDNEEEKAKKVAEEEAKKKIAQMEDAVDSAKVEKEKKEAQKKKQQEEQEKKTKENLENPQKPKKKNLDKMFEERNNKNNRLEKVDTAGMTNAEKGIAMQMAQEDIMTQDLLGDDEGAVGVQKPVKLNSEEDYKAFGKQTAEILYKGSCPYRIENFCQELFKELPEHCNAKQINEIIRRLQTIHNQKVKDEKKGDKNVKKDKPALKYGGAKGGYERNNNIGMVNDVMGGNEDEDEYGDYGDEQNFKRENEGDYDFM